MKVRLADIANEVGISLVTVSNALSGKSGVSEQKRQQIIETAERMGYEFKKDVWKGKQIGVLIPKKFLEVEESFYWELYQHLVWKVSQKSGFTLLEIISNEDLDAVKVPQLVKNKQCDALIVVGGVGDAFVKCLSAEFKGPLVFLDCYNKDVQCDSLEFNNYLGMYKVVKYLLSMGHKEIAYVGNLHATNSICDRYFGALRAMEEEGLTIPKEWVISDRDEKTGDMIEFKLPEKMPTAFVCNCDYSADLLRQELEKKGYRIPEDISVVGFDNFIYNSPFLDHLTTYDVNKEAMASEAVKLVFNKMKNKGNWTPVRKVVDGKVIIRDSVKNIQ